MRIIQVSKDGCLKCAQIISVLRQHKPEIENILDLPENKEFIYSYVDKIESYPIFIILLDNEHLIYYNASEMVYKLKEKKLWIQ